MSFTTDLRKSLSDSVLLKDASRSAGAGLWSNYVRATCYERAAGTVEEFLASAGNTMSALEEIQTLTKAEKNGLTSAKSVIKSAIERGLSVWQTNDDGTSKLDPNGVPIPRPKSELQNDRSDFEKVIKALGVACKVVEDDDFMGFDDEQKTEIAVKVKGLLARCGIV